MVMRRYQRLLLNIFSVVSVVLLWHYLSANNLISPLFLPPPERLVETFVEMALSGELFLDIGMSTVRILIGFIVAFLVAVPLGLLAGSNDIIRNLLKPWVQLLQPIPGVAWVPFAFLLFGLSNSAAVFIIGIAAFFPVFINVMTGVQTLDRDLINVAKTLGANKLQMITKVILPGVVPDLIAGSRVGIGLAWRAVVAAEMIGLPQGIGSVLIDAENTAQTDVMVVCMITLSVLMMIFEKMIFESLEKRVERWKGIDEE